MCWNELSIVYFLNHSSGNQCSVVVFDVFSANTKIWLDLEYSILTLTKVMLFSDPPNVEGGRRLDTVSVMGE